MKLGKLFIVSGPSQVGKDSIVRALWQDHGINPARIITNTTRAMRQGEKQGITYNFLSVLEFKKLVKNNNLLEWAIVRHSYFGTPKKSVLAALKKGKNVIIQIDVQGAAQIKKIMPATILIFITVESANEVKRRIFSSTKMTNEQKNDRWREAQNELKAKNNYDYIVINSWGELNETIKDVKNIIKKEISLNPTYHLPANK
jgi:guanylate kinase